MEKYIYGCDKCKKEVTKTFMKTPEKWQQCSINSSSSSYNNLNILICEDCTKKLGLLKEGETEINHHEETIREKLYNIFVELVQEIHYEQIEH